MGPVQLNVHSFLTDGLLIDTGAASLFSEFKQFFDEKYAENKIDQIVLTHHHEDHSGGAAYLQKKYELPISMHPLLIDECKRRSTYPFYRKLFWGSRKPFTAKPLTETLSSRTSHWQVIETPGHAEDHVALLNQQTGQLFSGDLYVHPETKLILRNESIIQIIHSLEHLVTFDFGQLFCCHAGYVKDGKGALLKKLEYLTTLRDKVLHLSEKGLTLKEIHQTIFPKRYPITYFSFGEWNSKHIIRSILYD